MKTAIICFAVLFCVTFVSARLGTRQLQTTTLNVQDFNVFSESLWDALALGHEYEDFESCMHQQVPAGILLVKAILNLNSTDTTQVRLGLKRLGKVLQVITAAIVKCEGKSRYWKTYQEMVDNFTNPENLTLSGTSFTIDGIEVYADMKKFVEYCSTFQIGKCGALLGDALGKVYYGQVDINSPETIAKINAIPDLTWTAGVNPIFSRSNLWTFKRTRLSLRHVHSKKTNSTTSNDTTATTETEGPGRRNLQTMPAALDARSKWPYCVHSIRDQGACASCWAVAASEVLSDRFCIASNRAINTVLGPQFQVSCDTSNKGCNGGTLPKTWSFLENYGITTESCFAYTSANFVIPTCSAFTKCQDGTKMRKYYAKSGSSKAFSGVAAIQQEIYTNGPVEAAIFVYSDLMSYTSGIYKQAWGSYVGGHAIKIIGWGVQNGISYWVISNSWGSTWGETGHARIAFGQIGIENQGYAGLADLTRS
jgi:cathepsin B